MNPGSKAMITSYFTTSFTTSFVSSYSKGGVFSFYITVSISVFSFISSLTFFFIGVFLTVFYLVMITGVL